MTATQMETGRASERGNVLFLILIAVALFAALSYAVTQSSRSGGGDANSEKSLVSSSQVTQYPAGIRTGVVRMIIGGVTVDQLLFDPPSNFAAFTTDDQKKAGVFYPTPGGGATYQLGTTDVMAGGAQGPWVFSAKYQVAQIGLTDPADGSANDIIAFLPGITKALCTKLDTQLGITLASGDAPDVGGDISAVPSLTDDMDTGTGSATGAVGIPSTPTGGTIGSSATAFKGQPFGCFKKGSTYVYYHVLVER